jgi:heptosyltransferase-3
LAILIIRAGALGDTLMLMPAITGLRRNADVIIAGRRPGIDYLRPYVDQCLDMETSGWHRLFMEEDDNIHPLPISSPDHVAAFLNDPDGRLRVNLKACFPDSSVSIFPVFPPEKDKRHIALYMAESIQEAGLPMDAGRIFEESLEVPLMAVETRIPDEGPIVIHPGSGSGKKNYPPLFWLELIRELKRSRLDNGGRIIMVLGPAEEDLVNFFRDKLNERDVELKLIPEREELMSILGRASVYIGHDSGITHLAAMLGRHVIALFKESSMERWRPLGPKVRIIKKGDYCLS